MSDRDEQTIFVDDDVLAACIVAPHGTLRDALQAIDDAGIGVCLVCDENRVFAGLLTDGDVRRAILAEEALDSPLIRHVSSTPVCASPSDPRDHVLDAMSARKIDVVPVVEGGRLIGAHTLLGLIGPRPLPNVAVIMAGGRGTRLGKLTERVPKPMLEVAGRPILERIVQKLVGHGIRNIAISVNYLADVIIDHFGDGSEFDCRIDYLREQPDRPLGTGGSLALLEQVGLQPDEAILVLNGDVITDAPLADVIGHHDELGADVTVCTTSYDHTIPFGVVASTTENRIEEILEKPTEAWTVNAGIYVIEPPMLKYVRRDVEFPIVDLVASALRDQAMVVAFDLGSRWLDVGRPAELQRARGQEPATEATT